MQARFHTPKTEQILELHFPRSTPRITTFPLYHSSLVLFSSISESRRPLSPFLAAIRRFRYKQIIPAVRRLSEVYSLWSWNQLANLLSKRPLFEIS